MPRLNSATLAAAITAHPTAADCLIGNNGILYVLNSSGGIEYRGNLREVALWLGRYETVPTAALLFDPADLVTAGLVNNDPIPSWTDRNSSLAFTQATAGKQPILKTNHINGHPAVYFDGTDDLLVNATAPLVGTKGSFFGVFDTDVTSSTRCVFGEFDTATANEYVMFGNNNGAKGYGIFTTGGTVNSFAGSTDIATGFHLVSIHTDGTTWKMRVDGAAQTLTLATTNLGSWFGDCTGLDTMAIGAMKRATEVSQFRGYIAEISVFDDVELTTGQIITEETRLAAKYGLTLAA